jgi:hypothetical protein
MKHSDAMASALVAALQVGTVPGEAHHAISSKFDDTKH